MSSPRIFVIDANIPFRSMHFIGMQAVILAHGEDELQLYYYASYTAGSFFLPIAVVSLSFSVFSSSRKVSALRIITAGAICGAAICGMHYVGQAGIVNYTNSWDWQYVFGSVIISMSAATVSLGIFFYLSSAWINTLWKRALCAFVLAGAVCAMHWTAISGTTFRWKGLGTSIPVGLSKTGAVWVCGALALSCCFVLMSLAIIFQYVQRVYAKKAQQISLALAYFAPDGTIMLNNNGHLPLNRITKNYLQYSIKDDFDINTAPFSWMYRVSRNWACVDSLIPSMRAHIRIEQGADNVSIMSVKGTKSHANLTDLKELYCVAAEDLAYAVGLPVSKVGSLYDGILNTGRMTSQNKKFTTLTPITIADSDCESGSKLSITLTRGQVLFLIRHLTHPEVTRLQTLGYSFAPLRSIATSVATSMQITPTELRPFLEDLAIYKEMPQMLDVGVHVACFIVRPVINGFEILAQKALRNQLPSLSLPLKKLEPSQISLLTQFDNWEATTLMNHWTLGGNRQNMVKAQTELVDLMYNAMVRLRDRVGDKIFDKAKLVASPMLDSGSDGGISSAGIATIIAFRFVADIHYVHPATAPDFFINARLFMTQQHCYPGSPDHAVFSGQVHLEFSSVSGIFESGLRPRDTIQGSNTLQFNNSRRRISVPHVFRKSSINNIHSRPVIKRSFSTFPFADHTKATSISTMGDSPHSIEQPIGGLRTIEDTNTEQLILPATRMNSHPISKFTGRKPRSLFNNGGGVHVSNEIHVTIADANADPAGMIELDNMGMKTEIGAVKERESAVDMLMALSLGELKR